jgi:hypothetical protein
MAGDAGRHLFGAGHGPIARVEVDEPEARAQLVNPAIDGWVIAAPDTIGTYTLPWRLIDPDGTVIYESVGIGLLEVGMQVDDRTRKPALDRGAHAESWAAARHLVAVDDQTQVTVRSTAGVPELLIFTPYSFGGSYLGIWPAERPTVNGGMVGDANSQGRVTGSSRGLGYRYLFGAGQGPVARVEVDEHEARARLVNPAIDGWVSVVPETIGASVLLWRLIGPDETVIFESVGIGLPEVGMKVDDRTQARVRFLDGIPELLVYTTNAFGGADLAVTAADQPTLNGGLAGTATSPGHRYLFGAGQGRLEPGDGVHMWEPDSGDPAVTDARARAFNYPSDAGWMIVFPDALSVEEIESSLSGEDDAFYYHAIGLGPSIVVQNDTTDPLPFRLFKSDGSDSPFGGRWVEPGDRVALLRAGRLTPRTGLGEDGCTVGDLIAHGDGGEVARHPPPLCASDTDVWVIGGSPPPSGPAATATPS